MRTVIAALLCLAAVLAPVEVVWTPVQAAIPFPYTTLSDAAKHVEGTVTPGACGGEYGAVMSAEIPIRYFVLYIGPGRILVGEWTSAETFNVVPPAYLWIGTLDKDGRITMQSREPYSEAKHGTGPCRLLYPERYL